MSTPADHAEENKTPPTTACPAWCVGHDTDAPDKDDDHLVRYQYPHDSDTWLYIGDGSRSHGLDITLESVRRLVGALARYVEDEE